jgi:tetratricopeptide (TPR) repeat protein
MATEIEALRARALDEFERGDSAGGITDMKAYLEAEPDDAHAWLALGAEYAILGGHDVLAADAFKRSVDLDGQRVDARACYADVLMRLGKHDLAAYQLVQANRIDPADATVMRLLGGAFYAKKLYDKAASWLERASAAAPGDARAAFMLGMTEEARHDIGAAIAAYRDAIARDPTFADAHMVLADALAQMGELAQAIGELDAVLALAARGDAHGEVLEHASHNREVLGRALDEMRRGRLVGKTVKEIEASTLVDRGEMKRKKGDDASSTRWVARLFELDVAWDAEGHATALTLVLPSPERAATAEDDRFRVTVVGSDGAPKPADLGTAATLTFLREALGCPMTQAGDLYKRLLDGAREVGWGGASAAFATEGERAGLRVTAAAG